MTRLLGAALALAACAPLPPACPAAYPAPPCAHRDTITSCVSCGAQVSFLLMGWAAIASHPGLR